MMNRIFTTAILASLLLTLTPSSASAEETTVTRTGVMFQLGKALNRAFLGKPKPRRSKVEIVERVHYANNVYAYQDLATADHDVNPSRGCFIHIDLDRSYSRKVKLGHSLAE